MATEDAALDDAILNTFSAWVKAHGLESALWDNEPYYDLLWRMKEAMGCEAQQGYAKDV